MSSHSHREQKRHSTMLIPYSFLYGVMPDYYPSIGVHCHPEFEMFVFKEGRCHFQIGDRFFTAQAGDVVLVQPDVLHGAEPIDGERVAYDIVLFHPQLMIGGNEDRAYQEIWLTLITGDLIADAPINIEHPYIAIGCGYPSIANFNRHFMKEVGMTPSEYRKRSEKQADISYQEFFEQAPQINPDAKKIKGLIGGMRVEMIEEPLMQQICWLEKLVDELVRGRNIQF